MNKPAEKLPAKIEPANVPATITPMDMIQIAVEKGHDLGKIEKLMDLERRWKDDKAREAYYEALSDFKKQGVCVSKDKINTQYDSRYTGIGNLVNTVSAAMAPFGLNARWEIDQSNGIAVTCILSHTLGHSEKVYMSGPPDTSGSKNALQQIKSTVTYLESSTFQAVTGVISQDASDDDGNASSEPITDKQLSTLTDMMNDVDADQGRFLKYLGVEKLSDLPASEYQKAVTALKAKKKAAK